MTLENQSTKSQKAAIAEHLRRGSRITSIDALNLFGCWRLGARIHNLREEGMEIETEMIEKNGKRVAQYYLS